MGLNGRGIEVGGQAVTEPVVGAEDLPFLGPFACNGSRAPGGSCRGSGSRAEQAELALRTYCCSVGGTRIHRCPCCRSRRYRGPRRARRKGRWTGRCAARRPSCSHGWRNLPPSCPGNSGCLRSRCGPTAWAAPRRAASPRRRPRRWSWRRAGAACCGPAGRWSRRDRRRPGAVPQRSPS